LREAFFTKKRFQKSPGGLGLEGGTEWTVTSSSKENAKLSKEKSRRSFIMKKEKKHVPG